MGEFSGRRTGQAIEERLARRLLIAHDRVNGDELPLTHELIAMMLPAQRPGVTHAVHELARRGLIAQTHNRTITVIDRGGLERSSGGTYGASEAEFQRVFG